MQVFDGFVDRFLSSAGHNISTLSQQAFHYATYLIIGFSRAKNHFGIACSNLAMMIHLGVSQVFERKLFELIHSAINRWWNSRVERQQLATKLREVDERVSNVAAPLDRREQAKVQKHTDEYVAKVEELLKEKEAEVMEI